MDPTSPEALDAVLRERGLQVPPETLAELGPAVRDLWALGTQLEEHLAALGEPAVESGDRNV